MATIKINDLNVRVEQPPPAAFHGKTIEQVVLELMSRVSTLEAKLQASKERITQLETKVGTLETGTTTQAQHTAQLAQHATRLNQLESMLADHDEYLCLLRPALKVQLFSSGWSGALGPDNLKVEIRAKHVKLESLSALSIKAAQKADLQVSGPVSIESTGAVAMSGTKLTADFPQVTAEAGSIKASKAVVHCTHLAATSVSAASYSPGAGNTW
jgi:TolA-binding protein